ncbi:MAG TPA: glycosyltransferase family 39 protein [Micromonosporaceae bacterium]
MIAVVVAALAATINMYGYHRDELYFRMLGAHPAWSYVDEPPLTPMLVRGSTAIFGDSLWALRLPAILCAVATIAIVALLARELGGRTFAQVIAALGVSFSFLLVGGHILLTASPDMVVWTLVILFALRAILRERERYWIYLGVTVGIGLYNKQLVLLLLIGLGVGLLISGPRRILTSRALWLGMLIAVVIALPTIIYQFTNDFPELKMSHAIAVHKGPNDRITFIPFQFLVVVALWMPGFIGMFTVPAWRRIRALGWAYAVVAVIVLGTGGQIYYGFGLLAFFMAAAAVRYEGMGEVRRTRPRVWMVVVLAISAVIWPLIALPIVPAGALHHTTIGAANQAVGDQIGWPTYVREVADVYRSLSPADQAHATIVTGNYGEAGSIDKFGGQYGLPKVYSGQNQLYYYGPPPASATVVIFVSFEPSDVAGQFDSCTKAGSLDNRLDVDNEEQGIPITVCRGLTSSWAQMWPSYQHYD